MNRSRLRKTSAGAVSTSVRAVFLVGFMGAGKSTVGRALARRLNWVFEDLDDRVELREGRTVAEIFRESGEAGFRRAERAALRQVLEEVRSGAATVIALGGGAFVQPGNALRLKAAGVPTVFLDAPVEELWRRCQTQAAEQGTDRPLLRSWDGFRELHSKRLRSYLRASLRLETGKQTVEEIVERIVQTLELEEERP